jgi:hypothetical protein
MLLNDNSPPTQARQPIGDRASQGLLPSLQQLTVIISVQFLLGKWWFEHSDDTIILKYLSEASQHEGWCSIPSDYLPRNTKSLMRRSRGIILLKANCPLISEPHVFIGWPIFIFSFLLIILVFYAVQQLTKFRGYKINSLPLFMILWVRNSRRASLSNSYLESLQSCTN